MHASFFGLFIFPSSPFLNPSLNMTNELTNFAADFHVRQNRAVRDAETVPKEVRECAIDACSTLVENIVNNARRMAGTEHEVTAGHVLASTSCMLLPNNDSVLWESIWSFINIMSKHKEDSDGKKKKKKRMPSIKRKGQDLQQ